MGLALKVLSKTMDSTSLDSEKRDFLSSFVSVAADSSCLCSQSSSPPLLSTPSLASPLPTSSLPPRSTLVRPPLSYSFRGCVLIFFSQSWRRRDSGRRRTHRRWWHDSNQWRGRLHTFEESSERGGSKSQSKGLHRVPDSIAQGDIQGSALEGNFVGKTLAARLVFLRPRSCDRQNHDTSGTTSRGGTTTGEAGQAFARRLLLAQLRSPCYCLCSWTVPLVLRLGLRSPAHKNPAVQTAEMSQHAAGLCSHCAWRTKRGGFLCCRT